MTFHLDPALRATRESFDRIPVIDIGPLLDGSDKHKVAAQIRWALYNVGFMYVRNHGVSAGLVEETFDRARAFFNLPDADKRHLNIKNSGLALRGYVGFFEENTDPTNTRDLKEAFDIGPEDTGATGAFFGRNQWPASLPGFRSVVSAYHQAMMGLSHSILRGIALSLDLDEMYFAPKMRSPISIQRLLHYPSQDGRIDRSTIGIGAHTDYGSLTVLAQDDVGGLQVLNRDGAWVEAPPIPETFVINIGDLIQRLTNDQYVANMHRVVNTSGRERYSIPFFIDADADAVFEPLETCITAECPARYPSVICGEHKLSRFIASFPHLAA